MELVPRHNSLLSIFAILLSACAPSQSITQTAIAQTKAAAPTVTPAPLIGLPTPAGCIHWTKVDRSDEGEVICVYGNLLYQKSFSKDAVHLFTLMRFSEDVSNFYALQDLQVKAENGDCITVAGSLAYDSNGSPYISGGDIAKC